MKKDPLYIIINHLGQDGKIFETIRNYNNHKNICIPITRNNPLKACFFSNKKYLITIDSNCKRAYQKTGFKGIFKDYWCTKSITYHFLFRFIAQ